MSYITEEQQVKELKDWWKDNGKFIIVVFLFVIAGVVGWRYWQQHQHESNLQLSSQYNELMNNYASGDATTSDVNMFIEQNKGDTYSEFALLSEAQRAVDSDNLTLAETLLQRAVKSSEDGNLTSIVNLRLAAVQIELKKYSQAANTLANVTAQAWIGNKSILKGNIALAENKPSQAKVDFNEALLSENISDIEKQVIQIKLDNLK